MFMHSLKNGESYLRWPVVQEQIRFPNISRWNSVQEKIGECRYLYLWYVESVICWCLYFWYLECVLCWGLEIFYWQTWFLICSESLTCSTSDSHLAIPKSNFALRLITSYKMNYIGLKKLNKLLGKLQRYALTKGEEREEREEREKQQQ